MHYAFKNGLKEHLDNQKGRIISRQNLNEYLKTLNQAPTQFCDLPGLYSKIGFLRCHPLSLLDNGVKAKKCIIKT